jgi:anti-sigma regulatory factor (Ser/Thr protein kinase)
VAALYTECFNVDGSDFANAGKASTQIKMILKQIGVPREIIRRVAIASYEAEMNIVMYAKKGVMSLRVEPEKVQIDVADEGPGIDDIDLAMQEGYSTASAEMREMGFGAGMGLPNIKRNTDRLDISSTVGEGTRLKMLIRNEAAQ